MEMIRGYLNEHPEFKVIARDRDASYAEAIRWAVQQAQAALNRCTLSRT